MGPRSVQLTVCFEVPGICKIKTTRFSSKFVFTSCVYTIVLTIVMLRSRVLLHPVHVLYGPMQGYTSRVYEESGQHLTPQNSGSACVCLYSRSDPYGNEFPGVASIGLPCRE